MCRTWWTSICGTTRSMRPCRRLWGGTFAQQIICRSVPHRSEKDEEFYQASSDPFQQQAMRQQKACIREDTCRCMHHQMPMAGWCGKHESENVLRS